RGRCAGVIPRIALMNRAISTISWPYSSYASASVADQRRSSRTVRPWSLTRQRESLSRGVKVPSRGRIVEAVAGQLQLADDLGTEQRDDVGERREAEAGHDLLGRRGAAEDMAR